MEPPPPTSLGTPSRQRRVGKPADPHRLIRALQRGKKWIIGGAIVACVIGFVVGKFVMPREYRTNATLVFDGVPAIEGVRAPDQRDLRTLVDSVKIPTNLKEVRRRLGMKTQLPILGSRIEVSHSGESNVFAIAALASAPDEAKRLADTMVDVFLSSQEVAERKRLKKHLHDVTHGLRGANDQLAKAQHAYDAFRSSNGVADLSVDRQQAIEAAAQLRASADLAGAEATALEARVRELSSAQQRQAAMTVVSETRSSPSSAEAARLRTELAQARAQYSDDHPQVRSLEARLEALLARGEKNQTVVGDRVLGANPAYQALQQTMTGSAAERQAALERRSSFEALATQAQQRVEQLSAMEGQASALLAEVRVAENHVGELQTLETRLRDAVRSPATGFRVVAPAIEPDQPESSKKRFFVAAAIPAVTVLAMLLYFLFQEFRGLRVRTPEEISYWGGGPVVGTTSWPRNPGALAELVEELDDSVPDARGSTLVVGASEAERALANEIAHKLNDDWSPTGLVDLETYSSHMTAGALLTSGDPKPQEELSALPVRRAEPDAIEPYGGSGVLADAWHGPLQGPALRRAARLADRVLVVVSAGGMSSMEMTRVRTRLGRVEGVGFVLVNFEEELGDLPDRVGPVEAFWRTHRT